MPTNRALTAIGALAIGTIGAAVLATDRAEETPRDIVITAESEPVPYSKYAAYEGRELIAVPTTTTIAPPPTTSTTHYHPPTTSTAPPEPVSAPEPQAVAAASSGAPGDPYSDASWDRLAQCESGGNWSINTGNGYYGGIQFSLSSWQAVGGTGYPHEHSRSTQITMGQRLWEQGGWAHWPGCTRSLGWR